MDDWIYIECSIIKETERAFLVRLAADDSQHWLPKNQIADPDNYAEGDQDCGISITAWIAEQKGIST